MAVLGIQKDYLEAARAMLAHVKDGTLAETTDGDTPVATVEGRWEMFDRMELGMWGGTIRFVFRGRGAGYREALEDDGYYSLLGRIAAAFPALAGVINSPATLQVFKEVRIVTESEVRTWEDGRYKGTEWTKDERAEWRDVTEEFARKTDPRFGAGW